MCLFSSYAYPLSLLPPKPFKDFQQTRLSALRPPQEFFDVQRVSRPQDLNEATRRISHNTRYFGGNYSLVGEFVCYYFHIFTRLVFGTWACSPPMPVCFIHAKRHTA